MGDLDALLQLTVQLSAALDHDDVARIIATSAVSALGAAAGFVALATADQSALIMLSHVRVDHPEPPLCRLEANEQLPVVEAWRFGVPVLVTTAAELYRRYPDMDSTRADRAATASLPLEVDGVRLGALHLTFASEQAFDASQQSALRALAGLCAQALRRAALAQEVEQMRRDFSATASHELRTPLATIYAAASMLAGEFELEPEARLSLTRLIVDQCERMGAVVEDLRLMLDADTVDQVLLDIGRVDVGDVLRDATAPWSTLPPVGPRVLVQVEGDVPGVVADPSRLRQVLAHLVDNACRYSTGDSTIRLHAAWFEDGVRLCVRDEGVGLADGDHERAFEKFYRGGEQRVDGTIGAGLGLFVSRRLVEAMGGRIWLEPCASGVGACACVWLAAAARD